MFEKSSIFLLLHTTTLNTNNLYFIIKSVTCYLNAVRAFYFIYYTTILIKRITEI